MINLKKIKVQKGFFFRESSLLEIDELSIEEGINVVIGHNGSGKSLFLELIYDSRNIKMKKVSGTVEFQFDNKELVREGKKVIRRVNWKKNSWDDITFLKQQKEEKNSKKVKDYIDSALSETKYKNNFDKIKDEIFKDLNINELLGQKYNTLSGGQKKIVGLSIKLIRGHWSKYILLDEPFNHLDVDKIKNINNVLKNMKNLSHKPVIIVITHCNTISDIDKKYIISEGKVREVNDLSCKVCHYFR